MEPIPIITRVWRYDYPGPLMCDKIAVSPHAPTDLAAIARYAAAAAGKSDNQNAACRRNPEA